MDRRRPPPPDPSPLTANTRSFEEKYSVFASDEAARARVGVLGSDLPNGYTTVEEARRMGRALSVGPGDRLLDVGAGRGWPGSLIADEYGCDLLTADLPLNALLPARGALESRLGARLGVVCADGRRLPLGDGAFDAICHADVLC